MCTIRTGNLGRWLGHVPGLIANAFRQAPVLTYAARAFEWFPTARCGLAGQLPGVGFTNYQ